MRRFPLLAVLLVSVSIARAEDGLLFSFFRGNGETGLYLATSDDGLSWTPLNDDQPLLAPLVGESRLMRDPSITRGPDGVFHMVWTTSWQGRTLGYAHSKDLIHWSEQRAIEVFDDSVDVVNCWAPEIYYDSDSAEFIVVWASTIRDRFLETVIHGERGYNHRQYAFRTKDFQAIGKTELFYEPGFSVIDTAIFRPNDRYALVVKNETRYPPAKNLFLVFADSLRGPWTPPSAPISGDDWAEGATPIRIGDAWHIYFDRYAAHRYGAVRSRDLESWEDISDRTSFPDGIRHGTVFLAPDSVIDALKELGR